MNFEKPLMEAKILKRYKRFLADIKINNEIFTTHVPNTGSMTSCWEPNWLCAVSKSNNAKRKLLFTLELTHNGNTWIGVNTANANKLAYEWISNNLIPELCHYKKITPEKNIGESRIDFFLEKNESNPDCYVEVKSVTLVTNKVAQFPDAVSTRGQKHLKELMKLKSLGYRSVLLFIIQREDCDHFSPAKHIDPEYAKLIRDAIESGVEILCYQAKLNLNEIIFGRKIPVLID